MHCLAFDIYGTLIDTRGVETQLREVCGTKATFFSDTWRAKQLEYSFRRGLMRQYQDFSVCTRDALRFTCRKLGLAISARQESSLLDAYQRLPPFADAAACLRNLKSAGYHIFGAVQR